MPRRARLRHVLGALICLAGCSSSEDGASPGSDAGADVGLPDAPAESAALCVPDADCSTCGTCATWCACLVGEAGLGACIDSCHGGSTDAASEAAPETGPD